MQTNLNTIIFVAVIRSFLLLVLLALFRFCVTLLCFWYANFEVTNISIDRSLDR